MVSWLGNLAAGWFWPVAVVGLVGCLAAETVSPKRPGSFPAARWMDHLGLYVGCLVLSGLLDPRNAVLAMMHDSTGSFFAQVHRAGGELAVLVIGLLLLDLFAYAMHWFQHVWFPLWRVHAVHHADTEMDASTALRHHPLAYLQLAVSVAIVFTLLGLPVWVFPIYGVMLFAAALFQHINVGIPPVCERVLGWLLITPAMHQVHHSTLDTHYNRNFGNVLSVWDRVFGTLMVPKAAEQERIVYGLVGVGGRGWLGSWRLPFLMHRPSQVATVEAGRH